MPVPMNYSVVRWFVPAQSGTGLVPAANYTAKFYAAGTSTAKAIYDVNGTVMPSPSNIAILNSEGYASLKLGTGGYKIRICLPEAVPSGSGGTAVYTEDNIQGNGTFGTGFCDTVIASDTTGLKDVDTGTNKYVFCSGYWAKGDGGHGFFYSATSNAADDGGYIIASAFDPTIRWFRIPDETDYVRAESYGYVGTKSGNLGTNLLAAGNYCTGQDKRLVIGPGSVATIGTNGQAFHLYAPYIEFAAGSMLTGVAGVGNLILHGKVSGTPELHFTSIVCKIDTSNIIASPEWFGAHPGSFDNTAAFALWFGSPSSEPCAFILPPGDWTIAGNTSTLVFPTAPVMLYGRILGAAGSIIPTGCYFPATSRFRMNKLLFDGGAYLQTSGAGISGSGDITLAGAVNTLAGNSISSGANITALGDVAAGVGSTGRLTAQAGSSGSRISAGGQFYVDFSNATTGGTAETDLKFMTMPGNTFLNDLDKIVIRGGGTIVTTAAGQARRFRLLLGAVVLLDFNIINLRGWIAGRFSNWSIEAHVWRTGAGAIASSSNLTTDFQNVGDSLTYDSPSAVKYATGSLTLTGALTAQFKGTASTSGSVTQSFLSVDYFPAP